MIGTHLVYDTAGADGTKDGRVDALFVILEKLVVHWEDILTHRKGKHRRPISSQTTDFLRKDPRLTCAHVKAKTKTGKILMMWWLNRTVWISPLGGNEARAVGEKL